MRYWSRRVAAGQEQDKRRAEEKPQCSHSTIVEGSLSPFIPSSFSLFASFTSCSLRFIRVEMLHELSHLL